ncbi:MAG: hypothetical protein J7K88_07940 [Candidatus Fermentibacteraceae bacterium]|nr:hypothetical protein [Candidatus Fermentibacteraceae bacterium]
MNLRIGIVCEGPTDFIVIQAALNAVISKDFTATLLQPEDTPKSKKLGTGWCGVFKWCRDNLFSENYQVIVLRKTFHAVIIHLDADVAEKRFSDCGLDSPGLPCVSPCPPSGDTVKKLKNLLKSWMPGNPLDNRTVICIPSVCTEAWVVTALYGKLNPDILTEIECNETVENYLAGKPARERLIIPSTLKKRTERYRASAVKISNNWDMVTEHCSEAKKFEDDIRILLALDRL